MNEKLLDYLCGAGYLTRERADEILTMCVPGKGARELLLENDDVPEEYIIEALSQIYQIPTVSLFSVRVPTDVRRQVKPELLRTHSVIPIARDPEDDGLLVVAVSDPLNMRARDVIAASCHCRVRVQLATSGEIMRAIDRNFGAGELQAAARQYTSSAQTLEAAGSIEEQTLREDVNTSPMVMLINSLVEQAVRQRASDIHIEPWADMVRVRFRIDGILYDRVSYEPQLLSAIVTRIKVLSGLYISEKRKPQDGQFSIEVDKLEYDIRVSTLPTVYGEKCVLRIQQKKSLNRDKRDLGMTEAESEQFDRLLSRTYGIILVTGPTGSGKSTTLYTALSSLNRESVNIVTVEDPVEASIPGVNQVQVNTKAELTFASALRSILRQDPDIIMIGEIRDAETAGIAIQASITGHLVFSTLHTNDTASSVTRLLDIGVESYLIADATTAIIAQRLVRRLCPACKRKRRMLPEEAAFLGVDPNGDDAWLWEPVGCQHCGNTGYFDRIGIYEIMEVTPKLRGLIAARAPTEALREAALSEGMHTLRESARNLVMEGVTSVGEMARVADDTSGGIIHATEAKSAE